MMSDNSILEDNRFNTVFSDPKFKKLPKHERKVKIDKRFQSMFTHDSFKVKYTVDKRGRRISKSTSEDFKRFYDLVSDEENDSALDQDDSENDIASHSTEESTCDGAGNKVTDIKSEKTFEKAKKLLKKKRKHLDSTCETFPSLNEEEKVIQKKQISYGIRQKLKDMNIDYARGESKLFSESSSDESESEESETEIYHEWNELDKDADTTNHITNRLAVCNMDWDRIRAVDLMMLFNSFLPAEGLIYSIIIYPSEFGSKRIAKEEVRGPAELVNNVDVKISSGSDSDTEAEEGKQFHMERMRQYQLNRLKYYYAVATFDSPKTADIIYMNCNGVEYESSGIRLDLRFIDDDITFDQEPKDSCNNTNITKYEPLYFVNTALQQAKVELTWDETDPRRLEYTKKITEAAKTQDINDSDLENLVALSSSEEDDNEREGTVESSMPDTSSGHESENSEQGDPIQVYRTLLKEIEENDKDVQSEDDNVDLEIAWGAESGDKSAKIVKVFKKSKNKDENEDFTPFQRLLERKKEKSKLRRTMTLQKKRDLKNGMNSDDYENDRNQKKKSKKLSTDENEEKQKEELELLLLNETDINKHHFSLKKIKENEKLSKKKRKFRKNKNKTIEDDDFQVDVNDERFSALYASYLFNIDPTDPKFHKTKGMEAFVKEKQNRLSQKENNLLVPKSEPPAKKTKDSELLSLVTALKAKKLLPNKINKHK